MRHMRLHSAKSTFQVWQSSLARIELAVILDPADRASRSSEKVLSFSKGGQLGFEPGSRNCEAVVKTTTLWPPYSSVIKFKIIEQNTVFL